MGRAQASLNVKVKVGFCAGGSSGGLLLRLRMMLWREEGMKADF